MVSLRRRITGSERQAFTLVEILLVLAIMVVGTTLFVSNASRLIDGMNEPSVEERVDQAVKRARLMAVTEKSKVWLMFDPEIRALIIRGEDGSELGSFSIGGEDAQDEVMVRFREVQAQPYRSSGVWGMAVELSRDDRGSMEFWPAGFATNCVVEIDDGQGDRIPTRILYDPFSNARMEADL